MTRAEITIQPVKAKKGIKNIISISGGKDSTATALLAVAMETENMQLVFADTGHEHQATYDYVDYLGDKLDSLNGDSDD